MASRLSISDDYLDQVEAIQSAIGEINFRNLLEHEATEVAKLEHALQICEQTTGQSTGLSTGLTNGANTSSADVVPAQPAESQPRPAEPQPAASQPKPVPKAVPGAENASGAIQAAAQKTVPSDGELRVVDDSRSQKAAASPAKSATPKKKAAEKPNPALERRRHLVAFLSQAGYSGRLGKVFVPGSRPPIRKLQEVCHTEGLPSCDVCIAPVFSPIKGIHGIFLTPSGVLSAVIATPVSQNRWKVLHSVPYDNPQHMVELIESFLSR